MYDTYLLTTKDLHNVSQMLYRLLLTAAFDHLPLRTMSCHRHIPISARVPLRMQVLLPGTAFQRTFVASPHLQPLEDIWKRFYSLKFLTLPRTFNIVMSAGHRYGYKTDDDDDDDDDDVFVYQRLRMRRLWWLRCLIFQMFLLWTHYLVPFCHET